LRTGSTACGSSSCPSGATEQHGPHLPLSTDTDIALALAGMLAETHGDLFVAPAVAFGASAEHQSFAGTISVGHRAIELFLVELGRSASASFDHLVLLSTHGGNAEALARVTERLREEGMSVLAWSPRWGGDAHAGRTETSVMLALRPESVRLGDAAPGNARRLLDLMPALRAGGLRPSARTASWATRPERRPRRAGHF
jgi:creatinine amidohydrolase